MSEEGHFRKLEHMYYSAPINQIYKPKLVIAKGEATVTMEVKREYFHALEAVHGAIYFKMLDDAAFFAANSLMLESFALTTDFNLRFLKPITQGILVSKGKLVLAANTLFVAEARLFNDGKEVAFGSGSFFKSRHQLKPEYGYQ